MPNFQDNFETRKWSFVSGISICMTVRLIELNPSFMKNIFTVKETDGLARGQYKLKLNNPSFNQKAFGYESLRIVGINIWNKLPYHIKSSKNLKSFKELIKNWSDSLTLQLWNLHKEFLIFDIFSLQVSSYV